jgi:hypothetical protein
MGDHGQVVSISQVARHSQYCRAGAEQHGLFIDDQAGGCAAKASLLFLLLAFALKDRQPGRGLFDCNHAGQWLH